MLFLGIDIGSSSIKISVLDGPSGRSVAATHYPKTELEITSLQASWAEQNPEMWWDCVRKGCAEILNSGTVDASQIRAVGITYQMHGLVLVDQSLRVLRPAIIWCDSRAVAIGDAALKALGDDYCFNHLLNSPANFTAAKLRWVQQNEPDIFQRIHKVLLPGDYIALKLSGIASTTAGGLSEGILWNFAEKTHAQRLLDHWQISAEFLAERVPNMGAEVHVNQTAAAELGIPSGIPISYRCGDQPNNAFSLNVLNPGEIAANAGTSGVIYAVTDQPLADRQGRVNTFLHVTHTAQAPHHGVLMCVNGTGRAYSWLRQLLGAQGERLQYPELNALAKQIPIGSDGLTVLPFGNGAERIFNNRNLGAHVQHIDLNRHSTGHFVRATQEGIVFALNSGFEILKNLGGHCKVVRAPRSNMFLSPIFKEAFANTTGAAIELYDTDSAEGAARGAAVGCGFYSSISEAFKNLKLLERIEPQAELVPLYQHAYQKWRCDLMRYL